MKTDKIAILLATYNGEHYLREQIDSLLGQSMQEWVLCIHDDGSKDDTVRIINEYVQKYPEKIFIIDGEPTGCARNNFFYLFGQVEAPYYMCCDQDDVWLEDKVKSTFDKMRELETTGAHTPCLVYTELKVVDGELNTIAETMSEYQSLDCTIQTINQYLIQNSVTGCTMMTNRVLRDKMLEIRNVENTIMHDWWIALVAAWFGKVAFIEKPTILYRQHSDNSVGALQINNIRYIMRRIWQKKQVQEMLEIGRKQAKEFVEVYKLPADSVPARYSRLGDVTKFSRQMFYKKNKMYKTGMMRKIGQIIWG